MSIKDPNEAASAPASGAPQSVPKPEGSSPAIVTVPPGTQLVIENDLSRKMFIIKKGKARVYKTYHNQRITLAILGEGEVFGELSFFDAQPRSASVEALTTLSVIVIEGDEGLRQIGQLPHWIFPIFRSVFHRFREADQRLTVLQSMNEFQKRSYGTDTVAKTIYLELMRYIKMLKLLHSNAIQATGKCESVKLLRELDDVLGQRFLGLRVFWKVMKEHDLVNFNDDEKSGTVTLDETALDHFYEYLNAESQLEKFMLLSHSAMAVLRRIVGNIHVDNDAPAQGPEDYFDVYIESLNLPEVVFYKDGLAELDRNELITVHDIKISFKPQLLLSKFKHQSILKAFDHTIVNLD